MEAILLQLVDKYPVVAMIFMVVGILRAIFKPLMSLLLSYVDATPSKVDNEMLEKFLNSKIYAGLVWALDYAASIKLPKKK